MLFRGSCNLGTTEVTRLIYFAILLLFAYTALGLFNPRQWALMDGTMSDQMKKDQRQIKHVILRRLYPGLREETDGALDMFIAKISRVTHDKTDQSAADYMEKALTAREGINQQSLWNRVQNTAGGVYDSSAWLQFPNPSYPFTKG